QQVGRVVQTEAEAELHVAGVLVEKPWQRAHRHGEPQRPVQPRARLRHDEEDEQRQRQQQSQSIRVVAQLQRVQGYARQLEEGRLQVALEIGEVEEPVPVDVRVDAVVV